MATLRNDPGLDELATEGWDAEGADLDLRSTEELVRLMAEADAGVPAAVDGARRALAAAIDATAARLAAGGRIVYVGAGTSGRLALVDAVECQSTFGLEPGRVVALVAGERVGQRSRRSTPKTTRRAALRSYALSPSPTPTRSSASAPAAARPTSSRRSTKHNVSAR